MSTLEEFLKAVQNNEYGEYAYFGFDNFVLITDEDSDPYIHATGAGTLFDKRSVSDILEDMDGFTFQSVELDVANSNRESELSNEKVRIWQIDGFELQ